MVWASVASWPDNASGSPADLFGSGARSVGRAGTGVVGTSSPAAAYLNPAELGGPGPKAFRLGYRAANFALEAASQGRSRSIGDASGAVEFGVRVPLVLAEPLAGRLGIGLDVATPGSLVTRVAILDPSRGQFPLLGGRADALDFSVGLGALLPYGIRIGAGVLTLASVTGTVAIAGGASGVVENRVNDELRMVNAPVFGLAFALGAVTLGGAYRGELQSDFDLQVTLEDLGQLVLPPLSVVGVAQYHPAQWQLEAALSVSRYALVIGLSYEHWSELARLRGPTVVCPEGAADCSQAGVPHLAASDTWIPRVAATRSFELGANLAAEASVGYFHEPSPLPPQSTETNLWDNDRHVVTLGYRLLVRDPEVALTLGIQRHFLVPRVHPKSASADEQGGTYRDVRTSGGVWVSSLELEVPF